MNYHLYFFDIFKKNNKRILFKKNENIKHDIFYKDFYSNILKISQFLIKKKYKKNIILITGKSVFFFEILISLMILGKKVIILNNKFKIKELKKMKKKFNASVINKKLIYEKEKINFIDEIIKYKQGIKKGKIILMSSGTTNKPKIIQLSFLKVLESAYNFTKILKHSSTDTILHSWPHYYMAGMFNQFICPFINGSSIYLQKKLLPITYSSFWNDLKKNKITIIYLNNSIINAILFYQRDIIIKKKIKTKFISTGSLVNKDISKCFEKKFKVKIKDCYGVTEVGGSITIQSKKLQISPGIKFKVSKKKLRIESKFMFDGYYDKNFKLVNFKKKNFYPGDLVTLKRKKLNVIGRENDFLKKGGEEISLNKIEDIFMKNKDIIEVQCYPVLSKFWGEDIICKFVSKKSAKNIENQLKKLALKYLSLIEIPCKYIKVNKIHRTISGKKIRRIINNERFK